MKRHLNEDEFTDAVAGTGLLPEAEAHLAGCVSCRQQVADVEEAIAERRAALESEAPDWDRQCEAIMARVPAAPVAVGSASRRWLRPVLAIAATVVVAVGVGVLMPAGTTVPTPSRDLPIEEILAEVDAVLEDDSLPGFESIDLGVDDPESYFENGTS